MPVSFRILPEHGLVYVRYEGRIGLDEAFEGFRVFAADPEARAGLKHLVDLSAVTGIERDFPRLVALQAEKAGHFMARLAPAMLVYLAPTPTSSSMARMVLRSWEGVGDLTILVQTDAAGALSVLGLPDLSLTGLITRDA